MISILTHFYDIESTENVFTLANYKPEDPSLDVYYLVDTPNLLQVPNFIQTIVDKVHERNPNFTGEVRLYDLHDEMANRKLASEFGLSNAIYANSPDAISSYPEEFRLVCDTDPHYSNDSHPYLLGYNSYNYDTTELALYFKTAWPIEDNPNAPYGQQRVVSFRPTTAYQMRVYNDQLFSKRFKSNMPDRLIYTYEGVFNGEHRYKRLGYTTDAYLIRKNMLMSGRHIDVARLNEKASHNALKRLLGMLGGQILESDKLKPGQTRINTFEELAELIAYNASDVINLKHILFDHQVYRGNFDLKKGLLETYPELVYDRMPTGEYAPCVSPYRVRKDRLFIDSSSAQLATKALCPYDHLRDIPKVDFLYPAIEEARRMKVPQVDVLEQTRKLFEAKFPQPELRAQFYRIYNFYAKYVRGHNFNESKNFLADYGNDPNVPQAESSDGLPKENLCIPYFYADGTPSSCYAQFSIGGIHGAEYNKELYEHDMREYSLELYRMLEVKRLYPDPCDLKKAKNVEILEADGTVNRYPAGQFLKTGSTIAEAYYKDEPEAPELFIKSKAKKEGQKESGYKLNSKYGWTSADPTNHEDFKSYYPNLLCRMRAFWNDGLGYDRYYEIFEQKETLGHTMKDKSLSDAERQKAAVQREGTKLVLNSASGAADATFESNIRMNNNIIKMRVIGQLFSYSIAMAQTYYGARIPSTNTDGLYSVMEATRNNTILADESKSIGVEIEPETMYLISKDTNNRIELDPETGVVKSASGGALACQSWAGKKGPAPTKSLDHCAITDWALCEYLIFAATGDQKRASLSNPFNPEVGLKILLSSQNKMSKVRMLNMFQNVIASRPSSNTYIFATTHTAPDAPIVLQHYNRAFILRDNTPNTLHIFAATTKKLTPVTIAKRDKSNERRQQHDETALYVLKTNGIEATSIEETHEASVTKVKDIDPSWFVYIDNRNLNYIPEHEIDFIIANLDYGKYLYLLAKAFDGATLDVDGKKSSSSKGWRNKLPNAEPATDIRDFIKDIDTAAARLGIVLPGNTNLQLVQAFKNEKAAQEAEKPPENGAETQGCPDIAETPDPPKIEADGRLDNIDDNAPPWPESTGQEPVPETPSQPDMAPAPEPVPETPKQPDTPPISEPNQPASDVIQAQTVTPSAQPEQPEPNTTSGVASSDIMQMLQQQSTTGVATIQDELKQHLIECSNLVMKLKGIPMNGLTPYYIAELQRSIQTAIERV